MKSLKKDYYNSLFSHIYIEEEIKTHPFTQQIQAQFPKAEKIEIKHYKDVFCRGAQDFWEQKQSQKLILAKKQGHLLYEGAPVCQDFGNRHFYYTSCVMNCLFDCEYCYLQGMYSSANIVIFVNLEDIFLEVEHLLNHHSVYLCVSYDTDLLAFESITGFVGRWMEFAADKKQLKLEVRTKSAYSKIWSNQIPLNNVIFAFTLSPEDIIAKYEHNTPTLHQRIESIKEAIKKGFLVRLCFDPMIYSKDWKQSYKEMLEIIFQEIDIDRIQDVSLGVFRVSQDYMKKMRKVRPESAVVQFPYKNDKGVYHYSQELTKEMLSFLKEKLETKLSPEKIFLWDSSEDNKQ